MNRIILLSILITTVYWCHDGQDPLYKSKAFTIYKDAIKQGEYSSRVVSPQNIVSNYKSITHENYSNLIRFRFSGYFLNEVLTSGIIGEIRTC
ncbi:hypothetical protein [Plebeiibacterium sediminum]|uniref:Uncharacterized protein n=1 Tax=Plebeiibacterium sediminum TaxID=2992112 RepID=A0AAE3SHB1_9BACT|nr:hypothetical protein [Plebeiobacterium sediminum]MCW3789211.1 hypothetical protein [Plebeiobacterium sediminum]